MRYVLAILIGALSSVSAATEATVYLACDTNYTLAPERMSKKCCDPSAPKAG